MANPLMTEAMHTTKDGREQISDPHHGIALSVELHPRVVWMVLMMLRVRGSGRLSEPVFIEHSLS